METLQQERPPAYNTDPETLNLPSVPTHDLPPVQHASASISLPDLKSLNLPLSTNSHYFQSPPPLASDLSQYHQQRSPPWQHQVPLHPPQYAYPKQGQWSSPRATVGSPTNESVMSSEGAQWRAPSVMSLDDPETREAAETLSGLRNMEFKRSPISPQTSLSSRPAVPLEKIPPLTTTAEADNVPLLTLITAQHPWIGGTISGSLTAYNTTLQYSPAFIRNSATFLERNLANPVANGLETMSKRTGVDSTMRRYLGAREASPSESEERPMNARKRRKMRVGSPDDDVERGYVLSPSADSRRSRAASQTSVVDSLPAYDDNRSPVYEETEQSHQHSSSGHQLQQVVSPKLGKEQQQQHQLATPRPSQEQQQSQNGWGSQILVTTSGLGVALSDASLRSLKHCLVLLKGAFDHLTTAIDALRTLITDIEHIIHPDASKSSSPSTIKLSPEQEAASRAIADRVTALGSDIVATIRHVTQFVSQYTGRALPANAGALVRRQLLSVPQRYWAARGNDPVSSRDGTPTSPKPLPEEKRGDGEVSNVAKMGLTWLRFAEQGCEMIEQVTLVVGGTVQSAEGWLDSMGRKKETEPDGSAGQTKDLAAVEKKTGTGWYANDTEKKG